MATTDEARRLLSTFGTVRSQPPTEWSGPFALSHELKRFYRDVGQLLGSPRAAEAVVAALGWG